MFFLLMKAASPLWDKAICIFFVEEQLPRLFLAGNRSKKSSFSCHLQMHCKKNIPDLSHAIGGSAFLHISYQSIFVGEIHFTSGVEAAIFDPGATCFFGPGSIKQGTGADNGPGVFNDFDFNHSSLICLKLWRRDDFVVLPSIRNGVFVPRYARNWFIDH